MLLDDVLAGTREEKVMNAGADRSRPLLQYESRKEEKGGMDEVSTVHS